MTAPTHKGLFHAMLFLALVEGLGGRRLFSPRIGSVSNGATRMNPGRRKPGPKKRKLMKK